ncbi:membrane protein implicated in regulation of membrane protease activity [Paenibacillus shirakamiensis]|uniref:Membrane protein implicated in regulation of membrane protease activity n=1 Tax=Paenibacillus shirakamiensis TaxID=1265935 RepID=A0ABS4JKU3_9BACL|nr:NfeD family protein [Paenibacillus shirakamiensis]MBP2001581.1 membrane protein implicated in regulation of membrane protease activity [Paenibacillus shirakamiensis]
MHAWLIWLIIAGVLLIFEMLTLTFYLLWLSIGAAAAAVVAWIVPDAILWQVVVGCVVALGLTVFTRPLVQRVRTSRGFQDSGTDLVGREGLVVEPIRQGHYGIVKIGGDTWSASSQQSLDKFERVRVIERGNAIIEVERWEEI